jgi:hypothetical protein
MDHNTYPDSHIFCCENGVNLLHDDNDPGSVVIVISSLCDLLLQSKFLPAMPTTGLKMHSSHFKIVHLHSLLL